MKTILILADACKNRYVTEECMPFLHGLSNEGRYIKAIYPSPGFCERSEIFTGLDSYESGNFTAIGWKPEYSEYKDRMLELKLYEALSKLYDRGARGLFRRLHANNKYFLKPYFIPFRTIGNLALTEDGDIKLNEYKDIFDELNRAGLSYTQKCFTSLAFASNLSESILTDAIKEAIKENNYFIPVYIGSTDYRGHEFGDDLKLLRPYLQDVDKLISEIYRLSIENGYHVAVLGDHGMVPVKNKVDILSAISRSDLKPHDDFEMFLDSTYARFWVNDESAGMVLEAILKEEFGDFGKIVDETTAEEYRVPLNVYAEDGHKVYGDILWCADPGVLISPDYFNHPKKEIRGMHGYLETDSEHGAGVFIASGQGIKTEKYDSAELKDVCGELCGLLEIGKPNQKNNTKNIIER